MINELTADGLRELVAGATPGPWVMHNNPKKWASSLAPVTDEEWRKNRDIDAAMIVVLVNAVPQIIALVEEYDEARRVILIQASREIKMREALDEIAEAVWPDVGDSLGVDRIQKIARAARQLKETDDGER